MHRLTTQDVAFVLNFDVSLLIIFMRKEGTQPTRKELKRTVEQLCINQEQHVCCKTPFLCEINLL